MLVSASVNVRVAAARVITAVMAGASLDDALENTREFQFAPPQNSLLKALCYGVLRDHTLLSNLLSRMLERPLQNEREIHALLLAGLFQLRSMRVAVHAAVNETVGAASVLGRPQMRALVNAVLRRYQRDGEALEVLLPQDPEQRYSCPPWLAACIRSDWPQDNTALMAASGEQGPMTLRVNRRLVTRDQYQQRLLREGLKSHAIAAAPEALRLEQAVAVNELPGFLEGMVSVQDASAQLAASLLGAQPQMRVLDACAAPGGKTAHLLESVDGLDLLALDVDAARLRRVEENLERLRCAATVRQGDVLRSVEWWDRRPFDRILLDAPCSGTGVIRRHPDIKWLRRVTDIPKLAQMQLRMLDALWPMLAPGGALLYATCSILKAEGEDVVKAFLRTRLDAKHVQIDAEWGEPRIVGRRIASGGDYDGFYYARLLKR